MDFPPRIAFDSAGAIHSWWGWVSIFVLGIVGLIGVAISFSRRPPGRWFAVLVGVAIVSVLVQVSLGLWSFAIEEVQPGNQHLFYGIVILFTLAFAYIYRPQLAKRPALAYGLLLLFMMGLGIRGVMTFGQSF